MFVHHALPADEEADLFEMANLYPPTTGFPITVCVSPGGDARHDARIKVSTVHSANVNIGNAAVVALRPVPRVIAGELASEDFAAVRGRIALNLVPLIECWDGTMFYAVMRGLDPRI